MNEDNQDETPFDDQEKSKSQLKREYKAYQDLGKQLIDLPSKQLSTIPLSEEMEELIVSAQSMQKGTLNRQLRLIGSRMPNENLDAINLALKILKQHHRQQVKELHRAEQWRDQLLQNDQEVFQELSTNYPNFDRQYVNQLVRNANKEQDKNKPPKSARLLFQYLSDLLENDG